MARTLDGRYRLTRFVASGAIGDVWHAVDGGTDRPVAVKLLHPHLAADPRVVDRLRQARRTLTGLWHPRIARLIDLVVADDVVALVTDFVPGTDLGRLLAATGPLAPARAARIAAAVADALDAAHGAGMVHGDLKPANVIMPSDPAEPPRVTDFAVATLLPRGRATEVSPYAAPWVIAGTVPTPASDVHALGVILVEMLTGAPTARPGRGAGIDRALLDVVDGCVLGDRAARPSAGAVSRRLQELAPHVPAAPPVRAAGALPAPAPPRRTRRRAPLLLGGLVVVALVVAAVVAARLLAPSGPANPPPALDTTSAGTSAQLPTLPPEATTRTQEGGGEFVRYWFAALSYGVQTGDTAVLAEATSPQCQDCQAAIDTIETGYLDGGSVRGGAYVVRGVTTTSLWSPDRPVYDATVDRSARTTLDAAGTVLASLPALSFANCVVVLEWNGQRWQVREVITPGCVA